VGCPPQLISSGMASRENFSFVRMVVASYTVLVRWRLYALAAP
jgi:hypothetical protein